MVEHLPSMVEALGLFPNTGEKRERERERLWKWVTGIKMEPSDLFVQNKRTSFDDKEILEALWSFWRETQFQDPYSISTDQSFSLGQLSFPEQI